jgi:excisionase family DNA binding protein
MNDAVPIPTALLTPKQLAAYLNVATKTVYRHVWDGTWPYIRVGRGLRFVLADVLAVLQRPDTKTVIGKTPRPMLSTSVHSYPDKY